jgi:trans-aconitate 2-methyltransferase
MPDNLDEPSHRAMREVAGQGPFASKLRDAAAIRERILPADAYYDLLARAGASVDVWRTVYHHVMAGPADIVIWLRATGLKPFLDPLDEGERAAFLASYERVLAQHYPLRADGRVLLAFPRLFLVARL